MTNRSPQKKDVVLYHVPPSLYSQVARLGLVEKGVAYEQVIVAPGPPTYETYQPWYMRVNSMGTVPTLVVDGEAIDDSHRILVFLDEHFEGPPLVPSDEALRAKVERSVGEAYAIPERVLAYGSDKLKSMGEKVNRGRLKALRKWGNKTPEMRAVYDHKIADIESFMAESADAEGVESAWQATREKLDRLNGELAGSEFCCGDSYTMADVLWTVTVARQLMLGVDPFVGRPALCAWFERMKLRPSYKTADIWTRFKPEVMLPILVKKFRWQVLAFLLLFGILTAGLLTLWAG